MLKKTIEFEDYNGNLVKEDSYFNLTDAELMELELSYKGGLSNYLRELLKNEDSLEIMNFIKKLIFISYGKRSEDGKRFIKDEELTKEFFQTEAYSKLVLDLLTDEMAGAKFINGLVSNSRKMSEEELKTLINQQAEILAGDVEETTKVEENVAENKVIAIDDNKIEENKGE